MTVITDTANAKFQAKIREHSVNHVPVIAVVGRKEAELGQVALRRLGSSDQIIVPLAEAADFLVKEALPPDLKRLSEAG